MLSVAAWGTFSPCGFVLTTETHQLMMCVFRTTWKEKELEMDAIPEIDKDADRVFQRKIQTLKHD